VGARPGTKSVRPPRLEFNVVQNAGADAQLSVCTAGRVPNVIIADDVWPVASGT
jgi:hypothetical protein